MSLDALAATRFDLLVVGAGIHGAFAAWDAARRGLRVALIERADFGGGASANSLKIVHGGFRYLQSGDVARLRASCAARGELMRLAPHLVRPLACVVPTTGVMHGRLAFAAALAAYELLAVGVRGSDDPACTVPRGRLLDAREYARVAGPLAVPGAAGGALWYDALLRSPDRLLIEVVRAAQRDGAVVANYVQAVALRSENDGARTRVIGARVRDEGVGETEIHARLTLVAAGAGSRALVPGGAAGLPPFARACNIVLERSELPSAAVAVPVRSQRRMLFAVPWQGRLMLGTSQHEESDADAADRAVDELLAAIEDAAPALGSRREDVRLVHQGLLPGTPAALIDRPIFVDHEARDGVAGVLTMIGVKWTTAPRTAAHAVMLCARRLGSGRAASARPRLAWQPEHGEQNESVPGTDALSALYGVRWREVATIARESPELAAPLAAGVATIGAQVAYAVRAEMARHLDDIAMRRTDLGSAGHPGRAALAAAARIAAHELGWDADREDEELHRVDRIFRNG
jgi:glycerol-3-phosphate dehydrogenase